MAKKKDSIALYEAIAQSKEKHTAFVSPAWLAQQTRQAEEAKKLRRHSAPQPVSDEPQVEDAQAAAATATEPPPLTTARPGYQPLVVAEGERLRLTLSYKVLAIGAAALLVVVLAAFAIGKALSGSDKPVPPPPGPSPVGPAIGGGVGDGLPVKPGPVVSDGSAGRVVQTRTIGKHYLLVQTLAGNKPEHREAADRVVAFLADNGETADVWQLGGAQGKFVVVSLREFDSHDSPEAKKFMKDMEALGKKFLNDSRNEGKYDFKGAFYKVWK